MVANLVQVLYLKLDNYPLGSALAVSSMLLVGLALMMAAMQLAIFGYVFKRIAGTTPLILAIFTALAAAQALLLVVIVLWLITDSAVLTVAVGAALHVIALLALRRKRSAL